MRYNPLKYPGHGKIPVLCDVCGKVRNREDIVKVSDKYNKYFGLVVCKWDVEETNPQARPYTTKDRPISKPDLVRAESDSYAFLTNANDDRLPSAPRFVIATASTLGSTIDVRWTGPVDNGSSAIIGYVVVVGEPQAGPETTLSSNTRTGAPYYSDTTTSISSEVSYRVAAINSFGTGPYSAYGFYPRGRVDEDSNYLVTSQDDNLLTTGDGTYISIN